MLSDSFQQGLTVLSKSFGTGSNVFTHILQVDPKTNRAVQQTVFLNGEPRLDVARSRDTGKVEEIRWLRGENLSYFLELGGPKGRARFEGLDMDAQGRIEAGVSALLVSVGNTAPVAGVEVQIMTQRILSLIEMPAPVSTLRSSGLTSQPTNV